MSYLSPVLWAFLPPQLTTALLPLATSVLPALFPPSPPGSPQYKRNYRLVFTLLVASWLAYAFASREPQTTCYDVLGVAYPASATELRRAFRSLSRQYHPDRAGASSDAGRFVTVRHCYEVLSDSGDGGAARAWAYDHFGDLGCGACKTQRDYVRAGVQAAVPFYTAALIGLGVLALSGRASNGAYWRLVLLAALAVAELYISLGPGATPAASPGSSSVSGSASTPGSTTGLTLGSTFVSTFVSTFGSAFGSASPPFVIVRTLRRLAADAGVAVSQLADIWADERVDPAVLARRNLARAREIAQGGASALQHALGPLRLGSGSGTGAGSGPGDDDDEERLKESVVDRLMDSNAARHPLVLPPYDTRLGERMRGVLHELGRVDGAGAVDAGGAEDP